MVFTNGCFDILHLGHVVYLTQSKQVGDRLVVGINSDDSVKRLNKGPERPLNNEEARAKLILSLKAVDAVVIFNEDTPLELIQTLQPNILVKGGDYDPLEKDPNKTTYIVGSDVVETKGGEVLSIPFVPGYSTTALVEKILMQGGWLQNVDHKFRNLVEKLNDNYLRLQRI